MGWGFFGAVLAVALLYLCVACIRRVARAVMWPVRYNRSRSFREGKAPDDTTP